MTTPDSPAINKAAATIANGKAVCSNGAVVFTVERSGEYYRFYNQTYGYLCANGTGNNAFYSLTASEDADWLVGSAPATWAATKWGAAPPSITANTASGWSITATASRCTVCTAPPVIWTTPSAPSPSTPWRRDGLTGGIVNMPAGHRPPV